MACPECGAMSPGSEPCPAHRYTVSRTGFFSSNGRLVASVEVPDGAMACISRLPSDLIAREIRKAALSKDAWPHVVDEAYKGDPNKKLIRVGSEFYLLDVQQIETLPEIDIEKLLGA